MEKILTIVWEIKSNWASSCPATYVKFGEYSKIISCAKLIFLKKLFAIRFSYKHCNSWPPCLPGKMASKTAKGVLGNLTEYYEWLTLESSLLGRGFSSYFTWSNSLWYKFKNSGWQTWCMCVFLFTFLFRGVKERLGHLGVKETSEAWYEWHFNPIMLVSSVSAVTKVKIKYNVQRLSRVFIRCREMWSKTVSRVKYIFSIETRTKKNKTNGNTKF